MLKENQERNRRIEYRTVWDGWAAGVQEDYKTAPIWRRTKNQIPRGKGPSRCEDEDGGCALRDGSVCPRPTLPTMLRWREASGTLPSPYLFPPHPPFPPGMDTQGVISRRRTPEGCMRPSSLGGFGLLEVPRTTLRGAFHTWGESRLGEGTM